MANPAGESHGGVLRLDFDRRVMLQFRGSVVSSDAGLLAYRELEDALGLTDVASEVLADARTGKNGRRALAGLFRLSKTPDWRKLPLGSGAIWRIRGKNRLSVAASQTRRPVKSCITQIL